MLPGNHKATTRILLIDGLCCLRGGSERRCSGVTHLLLQQGRTIWPFPLSQGQWCQAGGIPL